MPSQFHQKRLHQPNGTAFGVTIDEKHELCGWLWGGTYSEERDRKTFDEYLERYLGLMASGIVKSKIPQNAFSGFASRNEQAALLPTLWWLVQNMSGEKQ